MLRIILVVMLAFAMPARAEASPDVPTTIEQPTAAAAAHEAASVAPVEPMAALIERWKLADWIVQLRRAALEANLFHDVGDAKAQEKFTAAWTATVNKVLDADKVLAALRSDIARTFTASDLEWQRNFAASEIGQLLARLEKYRFAEINPNNAALPAEIPDTSELEEGLNADPARQAAVSRLVAATGGEVAYSTALITLTTHLADVAVAAAPPGEAAAKVDGLIRAGKMYMPMFSAMIEPMILLTFAYVLEPVATRDIEAIAAELETPQGKSVTTKMAELTGRTLSNLVGEFGAEFMRQLKAEAAK